MSSDSFDSAEANVHDNNNKQQTSDDEEATDKKFILRIHAANLPRYGILKNLPDTYAVVTSVAGRPSRSGPEGVANNQTSTVEWGRTEIIHKHSHPQWTTTFMLNYEYGSECYFYVQVFRFTSDRKAPVPLGSAVCEVGDILGSINHTKVKRLPRRGGVIFCRLEPVRVNNLDTIFRFQFAARDLGVGIKYVSSPDTILQISKRHPNASQFSWIVVYRSSPVYESTVPTWDVGEIDIEGLCNGDLDRPLRLSVAVHKKNAQDNIIAECETTLRAILNTQKDYQENCWESDIAENGFILKRRLSARKQKDAGRLRVVLAQLIDTSKDEQIQELDVHRSVNELSVSAETNEEADPYAIDIAKLPTPMAAPATFQDYVRDGLLLDFCVAIDFTSSNGDPRIPGTLHDQSSENMNDYEETIVSIGNALALYSDQFAVWGFGAKFGGVTRHIFQCGQEAQVQGVEGILSSYKSTFESDLTMSGPTLFHDVIKAAAVRARKHQEAGTPRRYCVLLVITDGICAEMEETKRRLAVYNKVPLSVIFVGVGRTEFNTLENLCEHQPGKRATSTFVKFRQHQHDPASLGKAALKELPNQVVEYMQQMGIKPSEQ